MGGKRGKKLVKRKSDFQGPAGTSTYNFGTPRGMTARGQAECPLMLFTGKYLLTYWEKGGKEKEKMEGKDRGPFFPLFTF